MENEKICDVWVKEEPESQEYFEGECEEGKLISGTDGIHDLHLTYDETSQPDSQALQTETHIGKLWECHICARIFAYQSKLTSHMVTHTQIKNFKCTICDKSFTKTSSLKMHAKAVHAGIKNFKCTLCDRAFSHKGHLTTHMTTHAKIKNLKCTMCDDVFDQRSDLRAHMSTHLGEDYLKCHICNKTFSWKSSLTKHFLTHTSVRNHICTICNKAFKTKHNLFNHMETHSKMNLKCDLCDATFGLRRSLIAHMLIHSGVKNFKCEICEKAFRLKSGLTTHMTVHGAEKKHKCHICGYSCGQKSTLSKHLFTHSDRSFSCSICNRSFRDKRSVKSYSVAEGSLKCEFACKSCLSKNVRSDDCSDGRAQNSGRDIFPAVQEIDVGEPGSDDFFEAKYHNNEGLYTTQVKIEKVCEIQVKDEPDEGIL